MPLHVVCCYTHRTSLATYGSWRPADFDVKKFVDAIKDRPINRYATLPVNDQRHELRESNASDAFNWFGQMVAPILSAGGIVSPVVIPFPDSNCTLRTEHSRTRRLADGIASACDANVCDILRFDRPMASASKAGGPRDAETIYPRLRLIGPLPPSRPVVLVDDVVTSGGHLRAAAALLRINGHPVAIAACGVSAQQVPVPDPFARVYRELDDYLP